MKSKFMSSSSINQIDIVPVIGRIDQRPAIRSCGQLPAGSLSTDQCRRDRRSNPFWSSVLYPVPVKKQNKRNVKSKLNQFHLILHTKHPWRIDSKVFGGFGKDFARISRDFERFSRIFQGFRGIFQRFSKDFQVFRRILKDFEGF